MALLQGQPPLDSSSRRGPLPVRELQELSSSRQHPGPPSCDLDLPSNLSSRGLIDQACYEIFLASLAFLDNVVGLRSSSSPSSSACPYDIHVYGASEALWSDAGVATDYRVAVLYYDTVRPLLAGIAGGGGGPGASPPVSPAAPARAPESVTESAGGSGTTAGGATSASPAASAALPSTAPAAARAAVACDSAAFLRYLDRFSRFDASKLQCTSRRRATSRPSCPRNRSSWMSP